MSCRKHPESSSCPRLTSPNLKFCPECGVGPASISLEDQHYFSVTESQTNIVHIPIEQAGNGSVSVNVCILDSDEGVRLLCENMTITRKSYLDVEFPASSRGMSLGCTLEIASNDGLRKGDDFWNLKPIRKHVIAVNAFVVDKPQVELLPQVAILCQTKRSRTLELRNTGCLKTSVKRIRCSVGLQIDSPPSMPASLPPGSVLYFDLKIPQRFEGEGFVEVLDDGDRVVARTEVTLKPKPLPREIIRYTVGIDFGTSGTSIFVRDNEKKITYPLKEKTYMDKHGTQVTGDIRFPTYIYCTSGNRYTDWFYGSKAEYVFSDNARGVGITELKTKLREDNPPPYRIGDKDITPVDLTAWYFERLLSDLILPCIKEGLDQGDSALFIFSLPVLDQDVLFERQKANTLIAASKAGFEKYGHVDIALEPECAALTIVDRINRKILDGKLHDGNRILIFDSGGGTTDLYIGTLSIRGGQPITFRDPVLESAEKANKESWGGREITYNLGIGFAAYPELEMLKRCIYDQYVESDVAIIKGTNDYAKKYDYSQFEGSKATNTELVKDQRWTWKFPWFAKRLEDTKIKVSQNPGSREQILPELESLNALILESKDINDCASLTAKPVISRVANLIRSKSDLHLDNNASKREHEDYGGNGSSKPSPSVAPMTPALAGAVSTSIDAIFPVGGNCNLLAVQELLKDTFPHKIVLLEDEDLKLMVPEGTVLSPEQTQTDLPYEIRIEALRDGYRLGSTRVFQANGVGKTAQQKLSFDLPPREAVSFEVQLGWKGELAKAAVHTVANTSDVAEPAIIRFFLEDGWLVVKWDISGDSFNKRLYEI